MAAASSSTAAPPWIQLPRDITANILRRLGAVEVLQSAQNVCTTWRRVCQDPSMWRVVHMNFQWGMDQELCGSLCRQAVDYSQGQLVDLTIDRLYDVLIQIANRSNHLRRLQLFCCYNIVNAIERLPHLEELNIIFTPIVTAEDIQTIGISCPMLKSFTFCINTCPDLFVGGWNNEHALAIAKTMPGLRHLRFYAGYLNNEGLEAILDGCPHLESLDLRRCFYIDLLTDLGDRCFDQIKDVKGPDHSVSDIWWLAS